MNIIEKIKAKSGNLYGKKPVTIAFLGDSVTQGCFECYADNNNCIQTIFDSPNSYSAKLKEIFALLYPSVHINIINSGISGDNAGNGFTRLERDIFPYSPDLTVVAYGLNDSCGGIENAGKYAENLIKIFNALSEKGIEAIYLTPNMMNTYTSPMLTSHKELAETFAKIQLGCVLDTYIEKGRAAAQNCGVKICDCYAKWKKLFESGVDTTALLSNYFNHPVRDMHWLFAFSLFETIMFS